MFVKYFLLSFPISSFGLGIWQIKRLEWKKKLLADLEERKNQEPIDLLEIHSIQDLDDYEYRRIKATGTYDPDPGHQLYLKPRQLVINKEAIFRGKTELQSNIGLNVVTPFHVAGTNLKILVNRGWLPLKRNGNLAEYDDLIRDAKKEVKHIVGLLRMTDRKSRYGQNNDESSNFWHIRDIGAMSKVMKTAPIYIELIEDEKRLDGPIGGQTLTNIRNEHLNYAITWFSLSALSYLMWYSRYGRRKLGLLSKMR